MIDKKLLRPVFFHSTYFYSNIVHNILNDPFSYLRTLNEFYGDGGYLGLIAPYPKKSALHRFASHCIAQDINEEIIRTKAADLVADHNEPEQDDEEERLFWLDAMFDQHNLISEGIEKWLAEKNLKVNEMTDDHISDYYSEWVECGQIESLCDSIAKDVFFVTFSNRKLLENLNERIANQIQICAEDRDEIDDEYRCLFTKTPGVLRRAHIPAWARNAVFHRDRGHCVSCHSDLTGTVALSPRHFDHIIPLCEGGLNDVTNLQLLCHPCNLKKGGSRIPVSIEQQMWYSEDSY